MKRFVAFCVLMTAASISRAAVISEDFSSDPLLHGWKVFGTTNSFHWNSTNKNLEVIWDSSQSNSYYYHPLTNILAKSDDFSFAFDLKLSDLAIGVNPAKPFAFPLCVGFQNYSNAAAANFYRGSGNGGTASNLAEFAYYPDSGYGDTVWPSFWSTNGYLNYNGDFEYTIFTLPIGVPMRITISYTASNKTCVTTIATNGISAGTFHNVRLTNFTDFRCDTFAIESFSDAGQRPGDQGSLLAHGIVDNLAITIPPPPVQNLSCALFNGHWQAQFLSRTNWSYVLERTKDFLSWAETSLKTNSSGGILTLPDTNSSPPNVQFYRVKAQHL